MQQILKYFFAGLLVLCFFSAVAQNQTPTYLLLKVKFSAGHDIQALAALGMETDHGKYEPGRSLTNVFSNQERDAIAAAGFQFEVLVDDMQAYYTAHQNDPAPAADRSLGCNPAPTFSEWQTPANYSYGTMGGYPTLQQMLAILDNMHAKFPNLISTKKSISDTLKSIEGRPIYWVRISDNPEVDENEPEALYSAVHHAREPNSLSELLFYMWYLLEHYNSDPQIKYLVDHTALYFVPCVNPDGYVYNETTNPTGGGYWRKNRRDSGNGAFGVDINRNYGYFWGYNDTGSSPDPANETYRGSAAFSEPETRAMKFFCEQHHFKIALNAHTYGNLLIHPFGYSSSESADSVAFQAVSQLMIRENHFTTGLDFQTVGYSTNGSSDDWMYPTAPAKEKMLAMTPELGPGSWNFWPPQTAIDGLNKSMMWTNLSTGLVLLNYGVATDVGDPSVSSLSGTIPFKLQRFGLADGSLTVSLAPLSANIQSVGPASTPYTLPPFGSTDGAISFNLKPSISTGEQIRFLLKVDNGEFIWSDTIQRVFSGSGTVVYTDAFQDNADNLNSFEPQNTWATTNLSYYSAPTSITDSPVGNYPSSSFSVLSLKDPVNLTAASNAKLRFYTHWAIEKGYDYVEVLASSDNVNFTPLCGKYTVSGTADQDPGMPLYDGVQNDWVQEEMDLSDYAGGDLYLRLQLISDNFVEMDGFYFDNLEVLTPVVSSSIELRADDFSLQVMPNPAHDIVQVKAKNKVDDLLTLTFYNQLGSVIGVYPMGNETFLAVNTHPWAPGIYYARLTSVSGQTAVQKIEVTH